MRPIVAFDHHKPAEISGSRCPAPPLRKMDFNGAIISTGDRAAARRKIIQGKLISRVRLCDGKSERSINNGTIVSRRAVYEVPFVYPLSAHVVRDEMQPYLLPLTHPVQTTAIIYRSIFMRASLRARPRVLLSTLTGARYCRATRNVRRTEEAKSGVGKTPIRDTLTTLRVHNVQERLGTNYLNADAIINRHGTKRPE